MLVFTRFCYILSSFLQLQFVSRCRQWSRALQFSAVKEMNQPSVKNLISSGKGGRDVKIHESEQAQYIRRLSDRARTNTGSSRSRARCWSPHPMEYALCGKPRGTASFSLYRGYRKCQAVGQVKCKPHWWEQHQSNWLAKMALRARKLEQGIWVLELI
jgi:hypothetical protein